LDLTKIFSLKIAFFLAIASSILEISSWISLIYWNGQIFFRLIQAGYYYNNLNQIPSVIILYTTIWIQISIGGILSFIMLFLSFTLMKNTTLIIFNKKITVFQIGIFIIVINILNFFAASGYVVGGILGISAGMIILIKKYFEYIGHSSFRDKERDFLIEVDLT